MQSPEAKLSLQKSGLLSTKRELTTEQRQQVHQEAAASWRALQQAPAGLGLQLTAVLAAQQLGFLNESECAAQVGLLLAQAVVPSEAESAAQFAAGLVVIRQALPELAPKATTLLESIAWKSLTPAATELASTARLVRFFQVASGTLPADAWQDLSRETQHVGEVHVLVPASPAGVLLPGLWLDERAIVTGAAASQLAYARLMAGDRPVDGMSLALLLGTFPEETMRRFGAALSSESQVKSAPADQAALLITVANLLGADHLRRLFQQDPLVRAGRKAIAEFGAAAFGPNTSLIAYRELAAPQVQALPREATAAALTVARDQWDWHTVAGLEYKDSDADIFPGDAPLECRFAFTWDAAALHFHVEVKDSPLGFALPPVRNRAVFLFVDPARDGLVWAGPNDYKFSYNVNAQAHELFNRVPTQAEIKLDDFGYTVEAIIPWSAVGLTPKAGLEFNVSPSVVSEGVREWDAMLQLVWSSRKDAEGRSHLGVLRLK